VKQRLQQRWAQSFFDLVAVSSVENRQTKQVIDLTVDQNMECMRNAAPNCIVRLYPAMSDRGYDYSDYVGVRCGSE
jgi:hypothetical protein